MISFLIFFLIFFFGFVWNQYNQVKKKSLVSEVKKKKVIITTNIIITVIIKGHWGRTNRNHGSLNILCEKNKEDEKEWDKFI